MRTMQLVVNNWPVIMEGLMVAYDEQVSHMHTTHHVSPLHLYHIASRVYQTQELYPGGYLW